MSEIKADGSLLFYTDSTGHDFIFESDKLEIDHEVGWTHYRPLPGTVYAVYRNENGDVFLNLSKFQHERILSDLVSTPPRDVLEAYEKRQFGV